MHYNMSKNYDEFVLYLKIQFVPRKKQSPSLGWWKTVS